MCCLDPMVGAAATKDVPTKSAMVLETQNVVNLNINGVMENYSIDNVQTINDGSVRGLIVTNVEFELNSQCEWCLDAENLNKQHLCYLSAIIADVSIAQKRLPTKGTKVKGVEKGLH